MLFQMWRLIVTTASRLLHQSSWIALRLNLTLQILRLSYYLEFYRPPYTALYQMLNQVCYSGWYLYEDFGSLRTA